MTVYLFITASIHNRVGVKENEKRRNEYLLSIANCLALLPKGIIPIIIENSCDDESYLDVFNCDIFYTKNNVFEISGEYVLHKGINELRDIKNAIAHYNISDDDIIIKMTGRYLLFKDDFFQLVLKSPTKEAFVKYFNVLTHTSNKTDLVLGLFALKAKYFKFFEYRYPELGAEEDFVSNINEFIAEDKIVSVQRLWMRAFLNDSGKIVDI